MGGERGQQIGGRQTGHMQGRVAAISSGSPGDFQNPDLAGCTAGGLRGLAVVARGLFVARTVLGI